MADRYTIPSHDDYAKAQARRAYALNSVKSPRLRVPQPPDHSPSAVVVLAALLAAAFITGLGVGLLFLAIDAVFTWLTSF